MKFVTPPVKFQNKTEADFWRAVFMAATGASVSLGMSDSEWADRAVIAYRLRCATEEGYRASSD